MITINRKASKDARKGTNGVSTRGATASLYVFRQRDFLGTPVTLITFIFPKVPGRISF